MKLTTHVHLVNELGMCKRLAALLYIQCLDNVHWEKKKKTFTFNVIFYVRKCILLF